MRWHTHSEYKDRHALLSASKGSWLNYPDEKLSEMVDNLGAAVNGDAGRRPSLLDRHETAEYSPLAGRARRLVRVLTLPSVPELLT